MMVFVKWATDEGASKPYFQMGNWRMTISIGSHYRKPLADREQSLNLHTT